jgi:hypothetical protein
MSELWGKFTDSFDKLKEKIKSVAANPTPSPLSSNAMSIQNGGKRKRRGSKRRGSKRSGSKRSGSKRQKRKSNKKVRFSKKNKVYTYKRK